MFEETDCNLSAGKATLDFEALHYAASVAYGRILRDMDEKMRELYAFPGELDALSRASTAQRLKSDAVALAYVAEVLHALEGAETRKQLEIVNHEVAKESCPNCGEDDVDELAWKAGAVECQQCGCRYYQ